MASASTLSAAGRHAARGAVYTFAGVVENHAGMEKIGTERDGLVHEDLLRIEEWFRKNAPDTTSAEMIALHDATRAEEGKERDGSGRREAHVLLVRGGCRAFGLEGRALLDELERVNPDRKFLNVRRKLVQNKNARYNFNVADFDQTPEYGQGKGTVVDFAHLPQLRKIRAGLTTVGAATGLEKIENLLAEANVYHSTDSGIGFHGDSERRMVIGANMGEKRVIEFQAFEHALPVGPRVTLELTNNDMYFMCETACGHDWTHGCYRLPHYRHRAGYPKWLARNEAGNQKKWAKRSAAGGKKRPAAPRTKTKPRTRNHTAASAPPTLEVPARRRSNRTRSLKRIGAAAGAKKQPAVPSTKAKPRTRNRSASSAPLTPEVPGCRRSSRIRALKRRTQLGSIGAAAGEAEPRRPKKSRY